MEVSVMFDTSLAAINKVAPRWIVYCTLSNDWSLDTDPIYNWHYSPYRTLNLIQLVEYGRIHTSSWVQKLPSLCTGVDERNNNIVVEMIMKDKQLNTAIASVVSICRSSMKQTNAYNTS